MNNDQLHQEILRLAKTFSIEILPRELKAINNLQTLLPIGTKVFIPHLDTTSLKQLIEASKKAYEQEMIPVPHIVARRIENQEILENLIKKLREQAKIKEVLLIGGDPNPPIGEYPDTLSILKTEAMQNNNIRHINFAFHPDDHPIINNSELINALKEKLSYCQQHKLTPSLVSQLTINHESIIQWMTCNPLSHNKSPEIRVTIPGLITSKKLIKYAQRCGVKSSIKQLIKQPEKLSALTNESSINNILFNLAQHNINQEKAIFNSIHLSPFGELASTARWIKLICDGEL